MTLNKYNSPIYLSSNIYYLRTLNELTQQQVADVCGKKNTAVSNWERGLREPSLSDLGNIAALFKISVEDLIFLNLKISKKN